MKIVKKIDIPDDEDSSVFEQNGYSTWDILKEWSACNTGTIIFDSDIQSVSNQYLITSLLKKTNVYVLIEDSKNNLFGCFNKKPINQCCVSLIDDQHFLFSLRSYSFLQPQRWFPINNSLPVFYLSNETEKYFLFRIGYTGGIRIGKPSSSNSYCYELERSYPIDPKTFTYFDLFHQFELQRIVIIQMFE